VYDNDIDDPIYVFIYVTRQTTKFVLSGATITMIIIYIMG